ncbi:MAG: diacylglycerol kinase family lipid kinase, partial [Solirubrobacteraceae bacterium]|nr:diacylglycerol kinase family lipid kinase [Solirubrobacteraceae bacterium]
EAELGRLGIAFRTERTRSLEHAGELARAAASAGEAVVTLSGDGLIGHIVGVLRETPGSLLGVLPGGRGNDLARALGIPREAVAACRVLADGVARDLDVGDVDGRSFIGIASVGFDSEANRIANEAPARLGQLAYVYGALRALATWKPAGFTIEPQGSETIRFSGWSVGACNSKAYGGGMFAAPDAELDDGQLDVVYCTRSGIGRFLRILVRIFKGTHVELDTVHVLRSAAVRLSADRPFTVYADGDPIGELPVTIRVVPGALKVLCPAGS